MSAGYTSYDEHVTYELGLALEIPLRLAGGHVEGEHGVLHLATLPVPDTRSRHRLEPVAEPVCVCVCVCVCV